MLRWLHRKLNYLKLLISDRDMETEDLGKPENIPESIHSIKIKLQELFSDCSDFVMREIVLGEKCQVKAIVAYIDGLVDKQILNDNILKPLMIDSRIAGLDKSFNKATSSNIIKENLLGASEVKEVKFFKQTISGILSGNVALYIDGAGIALMTDAKGWESRSVDEPVTETVIRGPREGFTEVLGVNISMLRRKIKNPKLKFEIITLGQQTNTDICICYIKGIANDDIIETVKRRLNNIKTDAILESGYLEEFIEDAPFSIFPTVGNSEKPDIVAAKLLEGRVAIICDGTPFVLTVPYLFIEGLQSSEDYYSRWYFSTLVRMFRLLAYGISILAPALYVALISFHADVIPFKLIVTMVASREGIPFSPFVEAFILGIAFELLRESGVRMPRPVGQAVSIVGALILGEAAIQAGVASAPLVIVTAITAIASFIVTAYGGTLPILRMILLIAGNILGFLGIAFVLLILLIYLCSLRSFGVPYLAPFAPLNAMDLKDTFFRVPIWAMITRPRVLTWENTDKTKYRMKINIRKKED